MLDSICHRTTIRLYQEVESEVVQVVLRHMIATLVLLTLGRRSLIAALAPAVEGLLMAMHLQGHQAWTAALHQGEARNPALEVHMLGQAVAGLVEVPGERSRVVEQVVPVVPVEVGVPPLPHGLRRLACRCGICETCT